MSTHARVGKDNKYIGVAKTWLDGVIFRPLVRDDLSSLEWDGEYIHFRRLYSQVYESMQQGEACMWVVDLLGKGVIGQVFVQFNGARKELADGITRSYLYGFRIRPFYRGMGVGSRLLHTVEEDILQRRFRWITLNVARDNPGARRFYERHGFKLATYEAGRWSYLDHQGTRRYVNEPAWRMQKELY